MTLPEDAPARLVDAVRGFGVPVGAGQATLSRLSGGFSHETWRLQQGDELDAVVKIARPDGPNAPYDMPQEAASMEFGRRAGVPVPTVYGTMTDPAILGAPFLVMEFVPGRIPTTTTVSAWLDDGRSDLRAAAAESVIDTLALLADGLAPERPQLDTAEVAAAELDVARTAMEASITDVMDVPPVISAAHTWLVEHLDLLADKRTGYCHRDFRLGNLVFTGANVSGVLDWERSEWGPRLYDVAYFCLPGMRQGDRMGGIFTIKEMKQLWSIRVGEELDTDALGVLLTQSVFTELCNCLAAIAKLTKGSGRLSLLRMLPLLVRLERQLSDGIDGRRLLQNVE